MADFVEVKDVEGLVAGYSSDKSKVKKIYWLCTQVIGKCKFRSCSHSSVLQFILNNTLKFGNISSYIPQEHYLNGVFDKEGRLDYQGLPMCERTLRTTLLSLENDRLIVSTKGNGRGNYSSVGINLPVFLSTGTVYIDSNRQFFFYMGHKMNEIYDEKAAKLASKGGKICQNLRQDLPMYTTSLSTSSHKLNLKEHASASPDAYSSGLEILSKTVERAEERSRERRETNVTKMRTTGEMSLKAINSFWEECFLRNFSYVRGMTFLSYKDFAKLKKACNAHPVDDIFKFIEYCIGAWDSLIISISEQSGVPFKALTRKPDLLTLTSYYKHFVKQYSQDSTHRKTDREKVELRNSVKEKDRQIAELQKKLVAAKSVSLQRPVFPKVIARPPIRKYSDAPLGFKEIFNDAEWDDSPAPEWES